MCAPARPLPAPQALLCEDRSVEIHAAYGRHARARLPVAGRALVWHAPTAELLLAGAGGSVYRLGLDAGRWAPPLEASVAPAGGGAPGVNALAVSRTTALIFAGGDGGFVSLFDPRAPALAARLLITRAACARLPDGGADYAAYADGSAVTALACDDSGLGLLAGTADGRCLLYDLRRAAPLLVKPHQYGTPIRRLAFHRRDRAAGDAQESQVVLSADAKVIKMWARMEVRARLAAAAHCVAAARAATVFPRPPPCPPSLARARPSRPSKCPRR